MSRFHNLDTNNLKVVVSEIPPKDKEAKREGKILGMEIKEMYESGFVSSYTIPDIPEEGSFITIDEDNLAIEKFIEIISRYLDNDVKVTTDTLWRETMYMNDEERPIFKNKPIVDVLVDKSKYQSLLQRKDPPVTKSTYDEDKQLLWGYFRHNEVLKQYVN